MSPIPPPRDCVAIRNPKLEIIEPYAFYSFSNVQRTTDNGQYSPRRPAVPSS